MLFTLMDRAMIGLWSATMAGLALVAIAAVAHAAVPVSHDVTCTQRATVVKNLLDGYQETPKFMGVNEGGVIEVFLPRAALPSPSPSPGRMAASTRSRAGRTSTPRRRR